MIQALLTIECCWRCVLSGSKSWHVK